MYLWILIAGLLALAPRPVAADPADPAPPPGKPCVVQAEFSAVVNAGTADYLLAALRETRERRCSALLIILDTPGGDLEATRTIVQAFLNARVPVVVYVAPGGARAGSAGVFITMAAHVAAMAPGSTIGAAHPVIGMGRDPEEAGGEQLQRKIVSDVAALARAIAQQRGRNVEWAEAAVRESVSATATEARAKNIVDRIAVSREDLLAEIDGMTVRTEAGPVELHTRGATVTPVDMTLRQRAWSTVADPTVVYFLLMIGIAGILIELYSPGLIVPGVIGGFSLLLAIIGLGILPVNMGAVALIALAAVLLVAELFVASYGLLALGGLVALVIGGSLLIDRSAPDFFADATLRLSWGAVLPLAAVVAAAAAALAWRAGRLRQQPSPTGRESMVGKLGQVVVDIDDTPGQVRIDGERWRATAGVSMAAGTPVRVAGIDGLTLRVVPAHQPFSQEGRQP